MDFQKELEFLKEATVGLFNKKGVSFDFGAKPYSTGGHVVRILIVNGDSSTHGNHQRLELSYLTAKDTIHVSLLNNSVTYEKVSKEVKKEVIQSYMNELLDSPRGKGEKSFSEENDVIDFYAILNTLSDQVFSNDFFEFNSWKKTIYLHEELKVGYNALNNELHVHGGVGSVAKMGDLHDITASIELGTLPETNKTYMNVHSSIAPSPTYPKGVYEEATVDMFVQSVIEQYQGAWNKK
ncbi:hypothetical protein CVD28_02740 [Bacillus sp. M6-12]|uniref:hypothetical protein n=1 Tax=Bacillus sp. M6-12 TaxID=2054166 RepID=UPI000C77508E|nr:hypothetical protein [Bacillus sp. M6-12]PLS19349.1 hypothetical protein CVD28_02740 [Bacillus sp. M6-12]